MCYSVIKNSKGLYVRVVNGKFETCYEKEKEIFQESKAKNILNSLPKSLKRLGFTIENVTVVSEKPESITKIIENTNYKLPEDIKDWVEEFGKCSDIIEKAKARYNYLKEKLFENDNAFIDILHNIELEKSKDLYGGWLEYKKIRKNREKRREYKDEMLIIQNVLGKVDSKYLNRERIQKSIDGLFTRKYSYKVIETGEENEMESN